MSGDGEVLDAGLAAAQEALVRAMAAGGPMPDGFDGDAVRAAARGILRKRAGEVAHAWPALAAAFESGSARVASLESNSARVASHGTSWGDAFAAWAAERPTHGSLRDGWDFARAHRDVLNPAAARELALAEARWSYDGENAPRRRTVVARRVPDGLVLGFGGRSWRFGRRRPRS